MAQQLFGRETDRVAENADTATNHFNKVAGQAEDIANRVADQGREMSESMQKVARNFKGALDSSLREQPAATLMTAAIVGFLLGALWKS
jgi:ElaB/YqjD/DUF883 family membrane-anchored ribosome-binding protein